MNKASGTMSVWFNTSQNGTTRHIIGNQKDTAQLFNVYLDSSNRLNLSIIDNGVFRNVITLTDVVEKDKWNFVSVTWRMEGDTLKCKLYLNDKAPKEGTVVNPVDFTGAVTALGSSIKGTQQLNGRLQQFSFSKELLNDEEVASLYNAGRLSSTTSVSINYDELGRLRYKSINPEGTSFKTSYQYETGEKSNSTTTKVSELDNNGQKIEYSYDDNGNIEVISYIKAMFEATKIYYTYNELNELIREDNEVLNKTIKYSYDVGGNLIKKEEFAYTREVPGTPTKTYEYKYEDTNWKDKLTSFYDGKVTKPITYDAIGNPLTYDGYTYTWEQGRQLKSMIKEGSSSSFKYNDSGIRTEKTVDGVTTKYYLNGDQVAYEDNGTDKIYYTYDSDGSLVSMNLNGVEYYYIRNLQGDIIGLFDKNGTQVVSYTYDTWGKHDGKAELKDENGNVIQQGDIKGTLASTVGVKNPYRYRGYRYDSETGLYYLQSRYYNSEWGRFINADSLGGEVGGLLSHNIFAYCKNEPVNNEDPSGQASVSNGFRILYGFAMAMTAALSTVILGTQNRIDSISSASAVVNTYTDNEDKNRGPVYVRPPKNASLDEINQTKNYVNGCNKALKAGYLSPTGKVPTKGSLRNAASRAADLERMRAKKLGNPYAGHVGHVPDTTWTGKAEPYMWMDLSPKVNTSLGGQTNAYPAGYKPTIFIFVPN
nr:RHS repeat-associated core domain-containing protein [Clostridium pascui]